MTEISTETRSVVVEREIPFPPEKIWRALTQPHLIADWLMKNDFVPVVDHRFKLSADWGSVDCQVLKSNRTKPCLTPGLPMISRASSPGLSRPRARARSCAWSSRAFDRISGRPTGAPGAGGSGSLQISSRSWRG